MGALDFLAPLATAGQAVANLTGSKIPNTLVRTSHGVSIRAKGITVGMIQSWAPGMNRAITPCYEVNAAGDGSPCENVPGTLTGLTLNVTRYDLYAKRMETAFGTPDMAMLSDQWNPIQIMELFLFPDARKEIYLYTGCWFTNLGRTFSATDNRLVQVNATLQYVRKVRYQ